MKRTQVFIIYLIICMSFIGASTVIGAVGRIPIHEPKVISQSGTYILTQNIICSSTTTPACTCNNGNGVIVIDADGVTLDLGGKIIKTDVSYCPLIQIINDRTDIVIKNGKLFTGDIDAIYGYYTQDTGRGFIVFRDLSIVGNPVGGAGIFISAANNTIRVNIEHVRIRDTFDSCIQLDYVNQAHIVKNDLRGCGGNGISILGGNSVLIENNSIAGNGFDGISILQMSGAIIRNNTVSLNGSSGIRLDASDSCMIQFNTLTQNASAGIELVNDSKANTIDWNYMSNNYIGLYIGAANPASPAPLYNVFSNNRTVGNTLAPMVFDPDMTSIQAIDGGNNYCAENVAGVPGQCY